MTIIRPAEPSEDAELSRILCNAFLPIWNHNWFHVISEPLASVPVKASDLASSELTSLQKARIHFYLSLIKATRLLGGEVLVNIVDEGKDGIDFGAVLLWLPPHARMTITSVSVMYHSGFLRAMYDYGVKGIYRINFIFEANIEKMFKAVGIDEAEHDFVQMLASNPVHAGDGLASQLLRWSIERCQGDVVMDTTTMQAQKVYERMGFKVLERVAVETGCDVLGITRSRGQDKGDGKQVQRILMLRKGHYRP